MRYSAPMRFRGGIERRIFEAVLVVLAGCNHPRDPQEPTQLATRPPPTPDATFATPPPGDTGVAVVDATAPAPKDPKVLCADHKRRRIDRSLARQSPPPNEGNQVYEHALQDPKTGLAICTIVRERVAGTVTVMRTPHWCPQGGGSPPGPARVQVEGEKLLVERVSLRADGRVVKSELEWTAAGTTNEPRHRCGRRFEGLELEESESDEPGAQLAAMAELEAASVPAFDRLARELESWGAPPELVRRARVAMGDEIRHARVMTALAREYGHAPRAIAVPALPCRSLAAIAHENAVEGCVHEAYGALIATYQAERARPELRDAFRAIAVDERRHAELAEDVHAWILGQLADHAREAIEHARTRAQGELRASVMSSHECNELGLPGAAAAIALCDAYFA